MSRLRTQYASRHARLAPLSVVSLLVAVLALAACGSASSSPTGAGTSTTQPQKPLLATDADGRAITIPANAPQRIIALVPSNSEILGALGVDARVIAVDANTDYPADLAAKPKVTDANTGKANVEQIIALKPDLVLDAGKFYSDADKQFVQAGIQAVDMPQTDVPGVLTQIRLVGQLVHATDKADAVTNAMQQRINAVKQKVANAAPVSVYMEADDSTPGKPFVYGGGSFGDELIRDAGGTNIFGSNTTNGGFPQVGDESVIAANPQVIILTEDPNFGGKPEVVYSRSGWSSIAAVKNKKVYAILPDFIQRPGPRIVDGLEQLAKDVHPELFS